jgi:hypothetical protein
VVVAEAQHGPTCGLQQSITPAVDLALAASIAMVWTIDFNDYIRLEATEVDDHRTKRLLPAKLDPQLPVAQLRPQAPLRSGSLAT